MKAHPLTLGLALMTAACLGPGGNEGPVITVAAADRAPLDATPDPDGGAIWFVEAAALLRVPEGGAAEVLFSGAPLAAARGLVFSEDGARLYVADPAAQGGGAVFVFDVVGGAAVAGAPAVLDGTAGLAPTALDVRSGQGGDLVFFTGVDPANGQGALFVKDGAAAPAVVAGGLASPDGVAAASDGRLYVADRGAGTIFEATGGTLRALAEGVDTGDPAGVALTLEEDTLLVSAENTAGGHSEVLIIDLATGEGTIFDDVIRENPLSGGLHRAQNSATFAWCGVTAGTGGQGIVYRISF